MNKMNLPAPFRVALPTPPLPSEVPAPPPPPPQPSMTEKLHLADLSSDESEMESSDVLATSYVCSFRSVMSLPKKLCTLLIAGRC